MREREKERESGERERVERRGEERKKEGGGGGGFSCCPALSWKTEELSLWTKLTKVNS